MFAIVSQLFFFLGLIIIIFLVARKAPKAAEGLEREESLEVQIENHIGKTFFKIPWDKIDRIFEKFLEKTMRRLHILTMKIECLLQKRLESLKNKNKEKTSFIKEANEHSLIEEKEAEIIDLADMDLDAFETQQKVEKKSSDEENDFTKEVEEIVETAEVLGEQSKENEKKKNNKK